MKMKLVFIIAVTLAGMPSASSPAFAQSAAPGAELRFAESVLVQPAPDAEDEARRRLEAIPGGTALLDPDDLEGVANVSLADSLRAVPGVVAQSFFGGNDQPKLHVRGSGLQQNPVERGLGVLRDGLPLNRADGSYVVGLLDPRLADSVEVFRGYAGNRLGATVLGGALNFTSPTGAAGRQRSLSLEAGSFGQASASGRLGGRTERLDGLVQASFAGREGFRAYNESGRLQLGANGGLRLGERAGTRVFVEWVGLDFDVAGPLSRARLEEDPRQSHPGPTVRPNPAPPPALLVSEPGPNVGRDQPRRETGQLRLGWRATTASGPHGLDAGASHVRTDDTFTFPIAGTVRATDGADWTGVLRYAFSPAKEEALPLLEATALLSRGDARRDYFHNQEGDRGALFGTNDLDATTLSLSVGAAVPLGERLRLAPGLSWARATRGNADRYASATRPTLRVAGPPPGPLPPAVPAVDTSFDRTYEGWSPSLGLTWEAGGAGRVFAAASRSFEPPTWDDLLVPTGGTPNSGPLGFATSPLRAQRATTVEAGWRGRRGAASWDLVAYASRVEDELLSLRDASGAPLGTSNASQTRHRGVEASLALELGRGVGARVTYTLQDFRFADDPVYGENRLAGAAPHTVAATLRWQATPALRAEAAVFAQGGTTPVDNANTLFRDGFAVVDLRLRWALGRGLSLYADARNVLDRVYAASTLTTDLAAADQAVFLPGDGRSVVVGVAADF